MSGEKEMFAKFYGILSSLCSVTWPYVNHVVVDDLVLHTMRESTAGGVGNALTGF